MHGHRVAAGRLEAAHETESLVWVEHDERGGDLDRAARWFVQAVEMAVEVDDFGQTGRFSLSF